MQEPEWNFPYCPMPPNWYLDWQNIQNQFAWIRTMDGVRQDSLYHAEGDVLIHTGMVAQALMGLDAWRALPAQELTGRTILASLFPQDAHKFVDGHGERFGAPETDQRAFSLQRRHLLNC